MDESLLDIIEDFEKTYVGIDWGELEEEFEFYNEKYNPLGGQND